MGMKIGIFDSGLGGLSVLNEALSKLSEHEFLYYADVKNVPYGQKSRDEILKFSFDAVKFLIENGAEAVVVACNTATSVAIKELRGNLSVPIIGMEPAVKKAHDLSHDDALKTLVIATPVTVNGAKLKELITNLNAKDKTELLALPRLVNFAEKAEFESENVKSYLKEELAKFDLSKFDFLVLGCTHFNYFKDRGAKTVKVSSMLDKPERRLVEISGDFVGFEVPNDFIVGYGLDYNQSYRNLPYIISLKEEVYK